MVAEPPPTPGAPLVPVAGAAVGDFVPGRRAIANYWVSVDLVVGGVVEVVEVQPRAISDDWERVGLVGFELPTLAVGGVGLRVGHRQMLGKRRAPSGGWPLKETTISRRCCASQEPSAIRNQAMLAGRSSSGNSSRSLWALETTAVAA